jgi:hypothetical protein
MFFVSVGLSIIIIKTPIAKNICQLAIGKLRICGSLPDLHMYNEQGYNNFGTAEDETSLFLYIFNGDTTIAV